MVHVIMINFVHIFVVDPLGMDYSTTAITDRYNLMYSIKAYDILHPTVNYDISSGGGRPLPDNTIMLDKEQNKYDNYICYKIKKWN